MLSRALPWVTLFLGAILGAQAAPFVPKADDAVLERLPLAPGDPALRELRELNARLKDSPQNLPLALKVARGYVELGRTTGDPRYVGYAQAALAPWWAAERPPSAVLLLRAALRQRVHLFDSALSDLAAVIADDPHNAQARLMRATITHVTGSFAGAREECRALSGQGLTLIRVACLASVDGATGQLSNAFDQLQSALGGDASVSPAIRSWILTMLAEMAARAGRAPAAEAHFRAALALEPDDSYLLAAYADFLLDGNRPSDVESLLKGRERVDPLLLRLALAARASNGSMAASRIAQLRDRFEASRLRGDTVHLREEARFTLFLLGDPKTALNLARENWRVQKEPADLRILLEAALAAGDEAGVETARGWLIATGLEDQQIERLLPAAPHPH